MRLAHPPWASSERPALHWILYLAVALVATPVVVVIFFYVFTKGALVLRHLKHGPRSPADHVYPIYSQMWLMRLVDFQPVISAILLFQYDVLVSRIVADLRKMSLQGQDVLITSCAFGNVIPRVVAAALGAGARKVKIVDIIGNELLHARGKLRQFEDRLEFDQADATAMTLPTGSVAANVLFFLLHELDPDMKRHAIAEAVRLLAPGGKLFMAEFHKPDLGVLRALSWLYFKTFEPFGLALWDVQDPVTQLNDMDGIRWERSTALFGNFQVIVATRRLAD